MKKLLVALAFLWPSIAHAGEVNVTDTTGQENGLINMTAGDSRWPFTLAVVVLNPQSTTDMADAAQKAVTTPNTVAVAVSPALRHVTVRFGAETGIKPADYSTITAAGNEAFGQRNWRQGIEAVADRALEAKISAKKSDAEAPMDPLHIVGMIIGFVLSAAAAFGLWLRRQNKIVDNKVEQPNAKVGDGDSDF